MAGLFQPKRVKVPGLLSDDGLAARVKELSDTTRINAQAAPANTSAVEFTNQIASEAVSSSPTLKLPKMRTPGVELSAASRSGKIGSDIAGAVQSVPGVKQVSEAIVNAGTLSPAEQQTEQQGLIDEAKQREQTVSSAQELGELMNKGFEDTPLDPEVLPLALEREAAKRRALIEAKADVTEAEKTLPTQAWWLNLAQVGARSAAQMGVGTVRAPLDLWDTAATLVSKGPGAKVDKSEASVWVDGVDKALTTMLPGDKARSKQFVTELAAGGGSMVGFMIGGFAGRAVGVPAGITTGVLGSLSEADSMYQDADGFSATATQKLISLFAGAGLGATEAVPIDRAFFRADVATGGLVRRLLENTTATSLEEFVQEFGQTAGEDLIAKYAYDPNREIDPTNWLKAGVIGGITGGAVGGVTTVLSNGTEIDPVQQDETAVHAAVQEALSAGEQDFASIIGGEDAVGTADSVDGQGGVAAADAGTVESPAGGSAPQVAQPDQVTGDSVTQIIEQQAAYHGTPHRFDKFSMEKIGTGEGAQAFGHGLYFAGKRGTAEFYRDTLSQKATKVAFDGVVFDGALRSEGGVVNPQDYALFSVETEGDVEAAFDALSTIAGEAKTPAKHKLASDAIAWLETNRERVEVSNNKGALYSVDVPDDAELLDWDAPLSKQPEEVRTKLRLAAEQLRSPGSDRPVYEYAENPVLSVVLEERAGDPSAEAIYDELSRMLGPEGASEALNKAGIPGLRYLDAGSRTTADNQTRNYVIFDDSRITITDVEAQQANPVERMVVEADAQPNLDPLPGATGKPNPTAVKAAMAYSAATGTPVSRQVSIAPAAPAVTGTVSTLYDDMLNQPTDPAVLSSYHALTEEVLAQYEFAVAANGGDLPADPAAPQYPAGHPLAATGEKFWALHRFFGTGLEGQTDPENMWQAHARLFSASALPAFTTETRGPQAGAAAHGEPAERKIGLMRSTAWQYDLDTAQIEQMAVIAPKAQTETAAFKKWFGDSKVVDAEGAPLRMFHATSADFNVFRTDNEMGAHFGNASQAASRASSEKSGDRTVPVYLRVEHPLRVRDPGFFSVEALLQQDTVVVDAIGEANADRVAEAYDSNERKGVAMLQQMLREAGYDGLVYLNRAEGVQERLAELNRQDIVARARDDAGFAELVPGAADSYIAFEPTQIKSAIANVGTFDPNDPAIDRMTGTSSVRAPFVAEPTRPTAGITLPTPNPKPDDVSLTRISADFRKLLDLTARHGRLAARDSSVMGEYNRRTAAVRLRVWSDLSTLVHEGGHALNDMMAGPLNAFVQRNLKQINDIAYKFYAGDLTQASPETVRREGFAEFFRAYSLTPKFARQHWPQATADFEATLKAEDPKLLSGLGNIAGRFEAWLQLPSTALIENTVIDGRRERGINAAVKELKDLGFKTWMHEHARRASQFMLNRYASVLDLETQLLNLGETNRGAPLEVNRADSPTAILRLARNAGSRSMVEITDGIIGYRSTQSASRGLREALMTALGVDPETTPGSLDEDLMKKFDAYLVARRAEDEYRRFDAGDLERPPIGASKGDVMRALKDYEGQFPQFAAAGQMVHEYGMAMWQKRYDAGLMDKETYEEGQKRRFYAPLQRDVSDKQGSGADSLSFGSSVLTKGPRFRGSDRDIISPMTVLMHMTFALEKQIAENDAKRALAVLADRAGAAGALVERIPASQLIGQSFSVKQVAQRLVGDANLTATDASDLMTILSGSVDKGDIMTLFRSEQAGTQGENVVFFWENGKVAAIRLNDSELAADVVNTMNAVGRENMDWPLELLAGTSTVFRTAITAWPDFLVVNYIRDQLSAWVLSDVGFKPFVSGVKGMREEIRQKQWAKSYNAAGGIMGGMNVAALHKASVDRDIGALRAKGYIANVFGEVNGGWSGLTGAIKGLGRMSALSETGTRLGLYEGAYRRAIRDGLTDYDASVEAAYVATDYIDFGLNGNRMLTTRRLIPFLNAQLQGLYKMVRTLGGDEAARRKGLKFALGAYFKNINNLPLSRIEKQQLNTGRKAWLKMISLGLISAAIHFIWRDDPDYQEAGEQLRVTGWVIPMGEGRVAYIPKPFELALIANAVERGLEFASGDKTSVDRFLRGVAMTMTPPTSPPAVQTIYETIANKDFFTGREIVPSYMQTLEPELQYDNYSTNFAKWLGGTFNMSPMQIDHVMSGLGASAYRDINTMVNAADPTRPAPDNTDLPIIRRFVRDVRRGSTSAQDFWAQASTTSGKLERAAQSYKRYVDNGNELAANRYLSTLSGDERAYATLMTHFKPEEKRLNPFYRARQLTTIVSGMRREMSSDLGLADTTLKDVAETFKMTATQKQQVDELLSEIARREVRNTLIATSQTGWAGKEILPLDDTLDMLATVSPDTYDEYQRRRAKAKVYDAQSVYDYWPDVRDRLNADGEFAILSDAVKVAGVVF